MTDRPADDMLPVDSAGNGPRMRTLVFDEADALMMARAMLIAANTALMGGAEDARRRLKHYRAQLLAVAPAEAGLFRRETDIAEIAIAMERHPTWRAFRIRPHWRGWGTGAHAVVSVGDRTWETRDDADDATFARIVSMVEALAPMDRRREVRDGDDVVVDGPRPRRGDD